MKRRSFMFLGSAALVAACGPRVAGTGPGGVPVYRISARVADQIPGTLRDRLNEVRAAGGLSPVAVDPRLSAAAAEHARDMSRQNRPWLWGSDGSSPPQRALRAGYSGGFIGEMISESFESELVTLDAWLQDPPSRAMLLDPRARDIGIGWFQESGGKIWWSLTVGTGFGTGFGAGGASALAEA